MNSAKFWADSAGFVQYSRHICVALVVCGTLLAVSSQAAWAQGLRADPAQLVFRSFEPAYVVRLFDGDQPVPGTAISGFHVMIEDRRYPHMFQIEILRDAPGGLRVRANPEHLQIGVYDLHVHAAGQSVMIPIHAPLDELPNSLENQAAALGITVEELRHRMSLYSPLGRERIEIQLPARYYVGDNLRIAFEEKPNRTYHWRVNGETVKEGEYAFSLIYTFEQPGTYTFEYTERSEGATVAQWESTTTVVEEPPVQHQIEAGATLRILGPSGFQEFEWKVGGQPVSADSSLVYKFERPGRHIVECVAREPEGVAWKAFRKIVWEIEVTGR